MSTHDTSAYGPSAYDEGWATLLEPPVLLGANLVLRVATTQAVEDGCVTGRFWLVRPDVVHPDELDDNWSPYLPLAAFALSCVRPRVTPAPSSPGRDPVSPTTTAVSVWRLALPLRDDSRRVSRSMDMRAGVRIRMLGPYGNAIDPARLQGRRHLLVIATPAHLVLLEGALHRALDAGMRVACAVISPHGEDQATTVSRWLPIAVELRNLSVAGDGRLANGDGIEQIVQWADQILIAVDTSLLYELAYRIRNARFEAFAGRDQEETLVLAPVVHSYLCGYGACLACAVPTAGGGVTRACLHGPFFPLDRLITR